MSKVVKSVVRAVKKVVGGVVKTIGKVVRGVIKSPIFKAVAFSAAVYFGVPAVQGFMSGGLAGAGTSLSNAWYGLTDAASSLAGGQFAKAGAQLSAGFQGGVLDPSATGPAAGNVFGASSAPTPSNGAPTVNSSNPITPPGPPTPPPVSEANWFDKLSPNTAAAVAQGAFTSASTLGQGIMANSQAKAAEEEKRRQEKNYNTNIGTNLFLRSNGKTAYQPTDFAGRFGG